MIDSFILDLLINYMGKKKVFFLAIGSFSIYSFKCYFWQIHFYVVYL